MATFGYLTDNKVLEDNDDISEEDFKMNDIINNNVKQSDTLDTLDILDTSPQTPDTPCNSCVPITYEEKESQAFFVSNDAMEEGIDEVHCSEHQLNNTEENTRKPVASHTLPVTSDNLSVFYCSEGCFDQDSDCRQQQVVLPSFGTTAMD